MKLSDFKSFLSKSTHLTFVLPNGSYIPPHFHLTEVGVVTKKFIDCGGMFREESKINCQLWIADDLDHRLSCQKAMEIFASAESELSLPDLDVEVEYQSDTIGRYGLSYLDGRFLLISLNTDCLAKEKCGISETVTDAGSQTSFCSPESGCC